jgi:acetylornithine deacetylase/succinyl-diaminopimelate desuccinylase-like protein
MKEVLEYLKANEPRFIERLCEYVRFPSISAQPQHRQDLAACADWLRLHCERIGLTASIFETPGNPVVVAQTPRSKKGRQHFLVYGHYDVQPAEPFELWKSKPFEPRIEGRNLFARGASDNKGQHLAHLNAIEAYLATGTELPCDLTFVIEGEEEIGSSNLADFIKSKRALLRCDEVVISDTGIPDITQPALTYALRGIIAFEIKLIGPARDLHSGLYGGSVENPAMALAKLLAALRDENGRVAIPGFYDDVTPVTAFERRQMERLAFDERKYQKFLGVAELFGERGFSALERRTARPTLEINGLTSGYQGEGSKTIIPSCASAKITCRLVPNQDPEKVRRAVTAHLKSICPKTVRMEVTSGHAGEPYIVSPEGAKAQAALNALRKAFGHEPVLIREGGSIPIVNDFKRILGAETLLLGLSLPDDNPHSPNEKFSLDCYAKGSQMSAYLWQELSSSLLEG